MASDSSGRASPGGRHIYRYGQSPIGLVTFAFPPFLSVQVGGAVSPPDAVEPLVVCNLLQQLGQRLHLLRSTARTAVRLAPEFTVASAVLWPFAVATTLPLPPIGMFAFTCPPPLAVACVMPPPSDPIVALAREFAPVAFAIPVPPSISALPTAMSPAAVAGAGACGVFGIRVGAFGCAGGGVATARRLGYRYSRFGG